MCVCVCRWSFVYKRPGGMGIWNSDVPPPPPPLSPSAQLGNSREDGAYAGPSGSRRIALPLLPPHPSLFRLIRRGAPRYGGLNGVHQRRTGGTMTHLGRPGKRLRRKHDRCQNPTVRWTPPPSDPLPSPTCWGGRRDRRYRDVGLRIRARARESPHGPSALVRVLRTATCLFGIYVGRGELRCKLHWHWFAASSVQAKVYRCRNCLLCLL
ncbi:hypothetical protein LX32DRAFT_207510 [Colletotrichum zoysiae]|uniref:Uncharacterized protein n=1 Tax=Colletotrichum zoysiae TaxID=1216348 RepID=A0AAD9HNB4_9PEZI|nr:hypothetical protein LX32DRAFT_207510 [Colletotrichum zoysiae]